VHTHEGRTKLTFFVALLQELIVKHYKGGLFTEYLFGLKEGDKIAFKGMLCLA
jgi:NAD(P)H-flavin reductase